MTAAAGGHVAVQYRDSSKGRMELLPGAVADCAEKAQKDMRFTAIDVRSKSFASKL